MRRTFLLVALFVPLAAHALAIDAPESSMRWAERLLKKALDPRLQLDTSMTVMSAPCPEDARDAFKSILRKYGDDNGRAWVGLARLQERLGDYDAATESYERAATLLPNDHRLASELRAVSHESVVVARVAERLPARESVLRVVQYQPGLWAALSTRVTEEAGASASGFPTYTNVHLTVFRESRGAVRRVWRSNKLGRSGHIQGEFHEAQLYLMDVTGDGEPEIIVQEIFHGGSWTPSHLDIFTWRRGGLVHLLGVLGDDPLAVKDLNHDGRYEVINNHAVGYGLSHAEQPGWTNIYAYKKGTYQLANSDFPREFRRLHRLIRTALREYPNDFELLYYLGQVYEIQRRPELALRAYRRAEANVRKSIAEAKRNGWSDLASHASYERKLIRARIAVLTQRG